MKFDIEKPRVLIPSGQHVLTLREVSLRNVRSRFAQTEDGMVEKVLWRFESDQVDPESGDPYEFAVFTNKKYGNEKAALTRLLDNLVPGITPAEAAKLDVSRLIGSQYRVRIKHVKSDEGKTFADYISLEPIDNLLASNTAAKDDPFADQ